MIQTNIPCRHCGEPMIEMEFAKHFRVVCNNWRCPLYKECQSIRVKETELAPITTFMPAPLHNTISPPRGRIGKKTKEKRLKEA